jgi:hypothetical protein
MPTSVTLQQLAIRLCLTLLLTSCPTFAWSGPLDSVQLQNGAKVVRAETATVEAGGASGSDIFAPRDGLFILDFAVPAGKEMMITLITGEQYRQITSGRKVTGAPVMKYIVAGVGTRSAQLQRGNYYLAFNNKEATRAQISYRASFK